MTSHCIPPANSIANQQVQSPSSKTVPKLLLIAETNLVVGFALVGLTQLEVPGLAVRRFITVQTRNELRDYEPFA